MKGITRVDSKANGRLGWRVRVSYKGRRLQRYFSDRKLGGYSGALRAALSWRNLAERELGKPRSDERIVAVSPRGPDAVPGVRETTRRGVPVVEVTWQEAGRTRRTTISVAKHGREEALARGLALRAAHTGQQPEEAPHEP